MAQPSQDYMGYYEPELLLVVPSKACHTIVKNLLGTTHEDPDVPI
jgi:hypothetical protein